jgi:hypothetical protein
MANKAELDLVADEQTFIEQAGAAFSTLVQNVRGFLVLAKELEEDAAGMLSEMQSVRPPQTPAEDERVQVLIKQANGCKKTIGDHWGICSTVHQLHRRLTARRDRGVKLLDEAASIGNALHNAYIAAERLKAQKEQDRLRAIAEEDARRVRQAELERLEALALASESGSDALSAREQAFCEAMMVEGTSYDYAAAKAGYKDPQGQGKRLMKTEKIAVALKAMHEALEIRRQAAAVKAEPLAVSMVEVKANVTKAAGTQERTTRSLEVFDVEAWRVGVLTGAIPSDTMQPSPAVLNAYARSLGAMVNRWPGCKLVEKTQVV